MERGMKGVRELFMGSAHDANERLQSRSHLQALRHCHANYAAPLLDEHLLFCTLSCAVIIIAMKQWRT